MSLALWSFFWNAADWGGAPPPAPAPSPVPAQDLGSGGGSKRKKPPYIRAPEDFWEVRERYLRSIQAETLPEIPQPAPPPTEKPTPQSTSTYFNFTLLPRYTAERSVAISQLRAAENLAQLKASGARLIELNLAIAQARRLQLDYDRELRHQSRLKQLRKARRKVALLMASQLLLKILYGNSHLH